MMSIARKRPSLRGRFWRAALVFSILILQILTGEAAPVSAAPISEGCEAGDSDCTISIETQPAALLPDLQTLPPYDLQLVVRTERRTLYFSNSIANTGAGPLEIRGRYDWQKNLVHTRQQIQRSDGAPLEHDAGSMYFHGSHDHWHWEGFARYEIYTLLPYGRPHFSVQTSGKVSYCMRDNNPVDAGWAEQHAAGELNASPRAMYGDCGWSRQGISVGWVDTYAWDTPGQELDVSYLRDGLYALRSTANPDGILQEMDLHNNASLAYFYLAGDTLLPLGQDLHKVRLFQAFEKVERETFIPSPVVAPVPFD